MGKKKHKGNATPKRKLHFGENVEIVLEYMGDLYDMVKITCKFTACDPNDDFYQMDYRISLGRENTVESMYDGINTLLLKVNDLREEYYAIPKERLSPFHGE